MARFVPFRSISEILGESLMEVEVSPHLFPRAPGHVSFPCLHSLLLWGFPWHDPGRRPRMKASAATGLVGMEENYYVADFFDRLGFFPMASER